MMKFNKLTRIHMRKLKHPDILSEHGIIFERLENGDGRFRINIMVDGQRIHRVVGKESEGVTRNQVEELIAKLRTDARHGRLNLPKGRKTIFNFKEASEKYLEKQTKEGAKNLSQKDYQLKLHLIPFFNETPLDKILSFDIEQYKKSRQDKGVTPGTINRELATFSHLLTKAIEWQWIDKKPAVIKRFKEVQSRITYLTIEQIERLLQAAKSDSHPQIYLFILIGLETAMRRMEILSIQLKDIDLEKRIIHIPKAKAGERQQPMTSRLAEILSHEIKSANPHQIWLFPAEKSSTGHTMNIEKAFRRVVKTSGLDPKQVVRHTLRHTAITHLVQAGIDLPTVKRISGHKTLQMVERYSHQNGAHIQAAMDKLEQRYRLAN
jgi:integrase